MRKPRLDRIISFLAGEFLLERKDNGGTVVFLRTLLVSSEIYLLAISLKARLALGASWEFDAPSARQLIIDTIPWYGAIFAGVYAALYARFASQWTYLANLYNQMMASAMSDPPPGNDSTKILRIWQAGFVEDALDLHLATKPMFATVIRSMLEKEEVVAAILKSTADGRRRLIQLEKALQQHYPRDGNSAG